MRDFDHFAWLMPERDGVWGVAVGYEPADDVRETAPNWSVRRWFFPIAEASADVQAALDGVWTLRP
jgi:hypothetical protein